MEKPYMLKRPKSLEKYILNHTNKNYLFFNRKEKKAFCTCCGREIDLKNYDFYGKKLKHNERTFCVYCQADVEIKSSGYRRESLEENGRILWFKKQGKNTFAQLDEYDIDYTNYKPKVHYWPSAQYKFSKKENKFFKNTKDEKHGWFERKSIILPSARIGMLAWWQTGKYEKTIVYEPSLNNLGEDLKYQSYSDQLLQYEDAAFLLIKYFDNFIRYPAIEILEKSGFESIVFSKLVYGGCKYINWRRKELTKILNLKPAEVKNYRNFIAKSSDRNPTDVLINYKEKTKDVGYPITFEIAEKIRHVPECNFQKVKEYLKIEKAIQYVEDQGTNLGDYADYICDCELMKKDLKKKSILKPKNFEETHYKLAKLVEVTVDNKTVELFKLSENKIAGKYSGFEYKDLFIRTAEQPAELEHESEKLHHCVRTYAKKVANGISSILFIRKINEPDKPYYTLEMLSNGTISQIRGLQNTPATDEVKEFIEEWKKYIKRVNTKTRKEAA